MLNTRSNSDSVSRYSGIAISLHWLIAILIIGLLVVGKFMTSLDEADPLRFTLTQWHKSFGISILALSVLRLLWRLAHKAPPLPELTKRWERVASGLVHALLYVLMLGLPLTGWVMVSASPLNISTILFNLVPLPHLPVLPDLANKAEIAELFHEIHEIASGVLIALLLLHIGAALRHQFVQHDHIMRRMWPDFGHPATKDGVRTFAGLVVVGMLCSVLYKAASTIEPSVNANDATRVALTSKSHVTFTLVLMGEALQGQFESSEVSVNLDLDDPAGSNLKASVQTASGKTGNPQVDDALPEADWFDVINHPVATFQSTMFSAKGPDTFEVAGKLSIRNITRDVSFALSVDRGAGKATGSFPINRLDFNIGATDQPDDEYAGLNVVIGFEFQVPSLN